MKDETAPQPTCRPRSVSTSARSARTARSGAAAIRAGSKSHPGSSTNPMGLPKGRGAALPVPRARLDRRAALAPLAENVLAASRQLAPVAIAATTRAQESPDALR